MTQIAEREQTTGNESGANPGTDTRLTRDRSGPVRYELIDWRGRPHGPFNSATVAEAYARANYPDQQQDPDRTGAGWDVQVVGADQ